MGFCAIQHEVRGTWKLPGALVKAQIVEHTQNLQSQFSEGLDPETCHWNNLLSSFSGTLTLQNHHMRMDMNGLGWAKIPLSLLRPKWNL